jgi:fatty-acyl-CoA synthase
MNPALLASQLTVTGLFDRVADACRGRIALREGGRTRLYADMADRVRRTAEVLQRLDSEGTGRFAILSENRGEYLEAQLAVARLGQVIACMNWRLAPVEIQHCLDLADPAVLLVSPRHAPLLNTVRTTARVIELDAGWEALLRQAQSPPRSRAAAEEPWLILYTGGTTGLPKGAVISQRAVLARMHAMEHDLTLRPGDPCLAWPPMFHMGGTEPAMHALLTGGEVFIEDGYDPAQLAAHLTQHDFGWISVQPGTVGTLVAALEHETRPIRPVRACGVMPDLVPQTHLLRLAQLLQATYRNTFGSTETGTPPLSGEAVRIQDGPLDLAKAPSAFTELRLVDGNDEDVPEGEIGEMAMRGPTLFSGYWQDPATTAHDFRNGWFHMGDLFRRRPDGRYVFVDRAKYMIKSGGENIYPAEIERVLLTHPGVSDAIVIRQSHEKWGETPVALVATTNAAVTVEALHALCRSQLAGYKQPRRILLVPPERLARTQTGKLPRAALEVWVRELG